MTDPQLIVAVSLSSLAALAMVTSAGLAGWRGWLQLKRTELDVVRAETPVGTGVIAGAGARIEIADLRERIRKLEAIAAGVDL